jgi:preprotein translocase subunit SecA
VVTKLFSVSVRQPEEEQQIEAEDFARHAEQLRQAVGHHAGEPPPNALPPPPEPPPAHVMSDDMECPCGSGKPFRLCHGAEEEATV